MELKQIRMQEGGSGVGGSKDEASGRTNEAESRAANVDTKPVHGSSLDRDGRHEAVACEADDAQGPNAVPGSSVLHACKSIHVEDAYSKMRAGERENLLMAQENTYVKMVLKFKPAAGAICALLLKGRL
jgi:hypothetical protein